MVAGIPFVGGPLEVIGTAIYDRRKARADDFAEDVREGLTPEQLDDLEDVLIADDRLQDVLLDAIETAMRTRDRPHRRALAQSFAKSVCGAPVDLEELVIRTLRELSAADAMALGHFAARHSEREVGSEPQPLSGPEVDDMLQDLGPGRPAALAMLQRLGLVGPRGDQSWDAIQGGRPLLLITDLGQLVADRLSTAAL